MVLNIHISICLVSIYLVSLYLVFTCLISLCLVCICLVNLCLVCICLVSSCLVCICLVSICLVCICLVSICLVCICLVSICLVHNSLCKFVCCAFVWWQLCFEKVLYLLALQFWLRNMSFRTLPVHIWSEDTYHFQIHTLVPEYVNHVYVTMLNY